MIYTIYTHVAANLTAHSGSHICEHPHCRSKLELESHSGDFALVDGRECVALTTLRGKFRATYRILLSWIMQQQGLVCKFLRWLKRWWGNGSH